MHDAARVGVVQAFGEAGADVQHGCYIVALRPADGCRQGPGRRRTVRPARLAHANLGATRGSADGAHEDAARLRYHVLRPHRRHRLGQSGGPEIRHAHRLQTPATMQRQDRHDVSVLELGQRLRFVPKLRGDLENDRSMGQFRLARQKNPAECAAPQLVHQFETKQTAAWQPGERRVHCRQRVQLRMARHRHVAGGGSALGQHARQRQRGGCGVVQDLQVVSSRILDRIGVVAVLAAQPIFLKSDCTHAAGVAEKFRMGTAVGLQARTPAAFPAQLQIDAHQLAQHGEIEGIGAARQKAGKRRGGVALTRRLERFDASIDDLPGRCGCRLHVMPLESDRRAPCETPAIRARPSAWSARLRGRCQPPHVLQCAVQSCGAAMPAAWPAPRRS